MLCENGGRSLDYYFDSVENSVLKVTSFAENDLNGIDDLDDEQLEEHMETVRDYFGIMAHKTKGVLTYYYRVDPSVSASVKGFWYIDLDGNGFKEHEVTDITLYDVDDTSNLVWFTVPKYEGRAIWLPPYITDNLDVRVISYDAPVYYNGQFIGVIGIEVDYSTMADEVDGIRLYKNGYAFLGDEEGKLFYHPHIDVTSLQEDFSINIPYKESDENRLVRYKFEGKDKIASCMHLSNGMCLYVTVPVSETKGDWKGLVINITVGTVIILIVASLYLMLYTRRITRPLEQLTEAADKAYNGDYDFELTYDEDDELGRLTRSFKSLSNNVKVHINDLNDKVYIDSLTHVKNKGAFTLSVEGLQKDINDGTCEEFAIGAFDCDNLKLINDRYGHDKGDIYLMAACRTISDVFKRSPVFRFGGDEFFVILKNEDYHNLNYLITEFDDEVSMINSNARNPWDKVYISKGFAYYDKAVDTDVDEVIQRADKFMYDNKRDRKSGLCYYL
jgi:diguanylate cyclase (GGDEF)-like protein